MEVKESKRGGKLYYYLSRMNAKELKDLHAYFSSPLLGNSLQMARMLLTIQAEVLDKGGKVIDADLFQAEFFPNEALDEGKRKYIRIRLVQFLDRVMDFLAFLDYKADTNAHHVSLLKALHTRGWDKYFERTYHEIEAMPPKKDYGEYHLYRMRREIVRNDFLAARVAYVDQSNLPEVVERIDIYLVFIALKYALAALNSAIIGNLKVEMRFAEFVEQFLDREPFASIPEIEGYGTAYRMLIAYGQKDADYHKYFDKLLGILSKPEVLDRSEAIDLLGVAKNICNLEIDNRNYEYNFKLRDLYLTALKTGILTNSGMLSRYHFRTITNQMAKIGELEWSIKFMEQWKNRVAGDPLQLTYYVTKAYFHCESREYDKAIELLYNRIHLIEDMKLSINARTYLCRAAWEKREYVWLHSLLEAFRVFVIRNKIMSRTEKESYRRFLELFMQMCKVHLGSSESILRNLQRIRQKIEEHGEEKKFPLLYRLLLNCINSITITT